MAVLAGDEPRSQRGNRGRGYGRWANGKGEDSEIRSTSRHPEFAILEDSGQASRIRHERRFLRVSTKLMMGLVSTQSMTRQQASALASSDPARWPGDGKAGSARRNQNILTSRFPEFQKKIPKYSIPQR